MHFAKGHGTENDFVILPDPDAELDLRPELVRRLCDRRAGIGADGVLRVVEVEVLAAALTESGPGAFRAAEAVSEMLTSAAANALASPAAIADAGAPVGARRLAAQWFMDYRNADGSVAEMCGDGAGVFTAPLSSTAWPTARSSRSRPGAGRTWSVSSPTARSPWTWAPPPCSAPARPQSAAASTRACRFRSATRTSPAWSTRRSTMTAGPRRRTRSGVLPRRRQRRTGPADRRAQRADDRLRARLRPDPILRDRRGGRRRRGRAPPVRGTAPGRSGCPAAT